MNYDQLALKLVPPGDRPPVSVLRQSIAKTIKASVESALLKQREEQLPQLAVITKELEEARAKVEQEATEMNKKLRRRHEAVDEREKDLARRVKTAERVERSLANLVKAFEEYMAWMDGAGEVDESATRFDALRTAYRDYKGAKA